jgi:acetylornithine deacetylase/succinyl-diaminopimelate desuccinylase-like protein
MKKILLILILFIFTKNSFADEKMTLGLDVYSNKAHNVIPARATARFNVRYNNFHNANTLKKKN